MSKQLDHALSLLHARLPEREAESASKPKERKYTKEDLDWAMRQGWALGRIDLKDDFRNLFGLKAQ